MTRARETWVNHFRRRGGSYVITGVLFAVLFAAGSVTWDEIQRFRYNRQEFTDWVDGYVIEFAGEDPGGRGGLGALTFHVERNVKEEVLLEFSDRLVCLGNRGEFDEFVSVQSSSFRPDLGRFEAMFEFRETYPRGRNCVLRSRIEATRGGMVTKTLIVETEPFIVDG